jgi:hypothetical protein
MVLTSAGGVRQAVIRVATVDPVPAVGALEARGYLVREPGREAATSLRAVAGVPGAADRMSGRR